MDELSPELLLEAVAGLLTQEVAPHVSDPGLSFRLRVAAGLLTSIAAEGRAAARLAQEAAGDLRAVLPRPPVPSGADPAQELQALERALASALRARELTPTQQAAARQGLLRSLRARLAVVAPRFDLSEEIE